jgi:uncharacterized NAD(P)/FAD-binding protein YdhS
MRIGIVGGGFSGCMLAVHLLRGAREPIEIVLVERRGAVGRGVAYSAQNPHHLLNVRVANMSAFQDDPSHFLRWLWAKDFGESPAVSIPPSGHAFVSRGIYGAYIADVLNEAVEASRGAASLTMVPRAAVGLARDALGLHLGLDDGSAIRLDRAVLCVGNFPPAPTVGLDPSITDDPRYVRDPWDADAFARIRPQDDVLIVGTGLTMVDFAVLLDEAGHRGAKIALSRRGLSPARHEQTRTWPRFLDADCLPTRIADLFGRVRAEAAKADAAGYDWRSVVDSLRPLTQGLWRALPLDERRRFLRHVRPYWEVHRHRLAPAVADRIQALRASGNLSVNAGRIVAVEDAGGRLKVRIRPRRGEGTVSFTVDRIVNCSGPEADYGHIQDPFVRDLLERGLVRPDPCRLGLDVGDDFALVDARGEADRGLFALGPPTKAALWEITAVPDIRRQCEDLARTLLGTG